MKYHKVTVTMKNGFTYSYVCISKMLESMKKSSLSFWTEKVESVEITSEEYQRLNEVVFEETTKVDKKLDNVLRTAQKKSGKIVDKGKLIPKETKVPKFSSLENFFESSEPAPKNKKLKKRV